MAMRINELTYQENGDASETQEWGFNAIVEGLESQISAVVNPDHSKMISRITIAPISGYQFTPFSVNVNLDQLIDWDDVLSQVAEGREISIKAASRPLTALELLGFTEV